jgi:hypothetical protein
MLNDIRSVDTSLEQRLHGMKHSEFGNRIIWVRKESKSIEKNTYLFKVSKETGEERHMACAGIVFSWKCKQIAVQCKK